MLNRRYALCNARDRDTRKGIRMIQHLQRMFAYDDWANREVLKSLRQSPQPAARSLKLLAHIMAASRLWLQRLKGEKQTIPVWPDLNLPQCSAQANELSNLWERYLADLTDADLSRTCDYTNSKGEHWTSRVEDILIHVFMHSAYHRGQIASDVRNAGLTPAYTDFIHAVRQEVLK